MVAKYRTVYRQIKQDILRGRLKPGDRIPSERALAKERKMGIITAARALNELARDGYVVREPGRGTFVADPRPWQRKPNAIGKGKKRSRRIAVLLLGRHQEDPSYAEIVRHLVQLATLNECETRCWEINSQGISRAFRNDLMMCDGLVLIGSGGEDAALEIAWSRVPLVLAGVNPHSEELTDKVDRVEYRYDEGGKLAVEHLISLGHDRIGLVNGQTRSERSYADFKEGYRAALAWHRLEFDPALVHTCDNPTEPDEGYEAGRRLLSLPNPPTGIVCVTDRLAYGVCRAATEMGLSVPVDVSVVGGENLALSRTFSPPLTALHFSRKKLADAAVELLVARLNEPGREHRTVWLHPNLVVRSSTGPQGRAPLPAYKEGDKEEFEEHPLGSRVR